MQWLLKKFSEYKKLKVVLSELNKLCNIQKIFYNLTFIKETFGAFLPIRYLSGVSFIYIFDNPKHLFLKRTFFMLSQTK